MLQPDTKALVLQNPFGVSIESLVKVDTQHEVYQYIFVVWKRVEQKVPSTLKEGVTALKSWRRCLRRLAKFRVQTPDSVLMMATLDKYALLSTGKTIRHSNFRLYELLFVSMFLLPLKVFSSLRRPPDTSQLLGRGIGAGRNPVAAGTRTKSLPQAGLEKFRQGINIKKNVCHEFFKSVGAQTVGMGEFVIRKKCTSCVLLCCVVSFWLRVRRKRLSSFPMRSSKSLMCPRRKLSNLSGLQMGFAVFLVSVVALVQTISEWGLEKLRQLMYSTGDLKVISLIDERCCIVTGVMELLAMTCALAGTLFWNLVSAGWCLRAWWRTVLQAPTEGSRHEAHWRSKALRCVVVWLMGTTEVGWKSCTTMRLRSWSSSPRRGSPRLSLRSMPRVPCLKWRSVRIQKGGTGGFGSSTVGPAATNAIPVVTSCQEMLVSWEWRDDRREAGWMWRSGSRSQRRSIGKYTWEKGETEKGQRCRGSNKASSWEEEVSLDRIRGEVHPCKDPWVWGDHKVGADVRETRLCPRKRKVKLTDVVKANVLRMMCARNRLLSVGLPEKKDRDPEPRGNQCWQGFW